MPLLSFLKATDKQIVEAIAKNGSQRRPAENKLYEKYLYFIKEGMLKHKLDEDDCASAYSDAVLVVIDSILHHRFEGRSELKTYLFQIFLNKCVDVLRKKTTNKESVMKYVLSIDDLDLQMSDSARTILQKLVIQSDISTLYILLDKLGDKCKKMLLAWGEEYSDEEIAQQLNYNTAAVAKTSRLRCLEKLKELHKS